MTAAAVVLAAAQALVSLKNQRGYEVYYETNDGASPQLSQLMQGIPPNYASLIEVSSQRRLHREVPSRAKTCLAANRGVLPLRRTKGNKKYYSIVSWRRSLLTANAYVWLDCWSARTTKANDSAQHESQGKLFGPQGQYVQVRGRRLPPQNVALIAYR